ncbi:MAG: autotransporter domain-containing protein [Pseudomonadota bacterium]
MLGVLRKRYAGLATVSLLFVSSIGRADPIAADLDAQDNLREPGSITFSVHAEGIAQADPFTPPPIYVLDTINTGNAPPSVTINQVGDACVQVSWGADNPDGEPFALEYSLIAGNRTTSATRGTLRFSDGTRNLTPVTDVANGCGDPNNQEPIPRDRVFNFQTREDSYTLFLINSDTGATDFDGIETLSYTDFSCFVLPQNGTVEVSQEFSRNLVYRPDPDFTGTTDTFEYCITDNPNGAETGPRGTVTVNFAAASVVDAVDDTASTVGLTPVFIDVLANDTLGPETLITAVSATTGGGFASIRTPAECAQQIAGANRPCLEYNAPSSDSDGNPFAGDDTFTYTITAADGASDTATVTVTVQSEDPVLTDDAATTTAEMPIVIDVRANDTIMAGETLVSVTSPASGGSTQILDEAACAAALGTDASTRCIRYQPPFAPTGGMAFTGQDSFTYTVSNGGSTATANVSVTVEPADNPMRELVADTATTAVETATIVDVLGNDTLIDGDQLLNISPTANGGTVEILDSATCTAFDSDFFQTCVRYTPPATNAGGVVFVGDDSFTYTVGVADDTSTATVTISVTAPDGTPQPVADDQTEVEEGSSVVIDVLANDIDDGGADNLTIVSVTEPSNGVAAINREDGQSDTVTYTPNARFVGTDTFFYTVSDGDETTIDQAAQVTVTVATAGGNARLSSLALTPEELEIATAIDTVCDRLNALDETPENLENGGPARAQASVNDLRVRCNALIDFANPVEGDNTEAVRDALRQIAGEEVFAQSTISTQILNAQTQNIDARLAALRGGARGVSAQGLAFNVQGKALPTHLLARRAVEEEDNALLQDSRLGFFINGRLNFGEQDPTATENGFEFDTLGVTAGVDYRFRNDLALGAAIGFANAQADYNNTGGELESDSLIYTLYGTYFTDRLYIDVLASTGGIDFDSARTLNFDDAAGGVDTTAIGQTDGDQRILSANFGLNFDRGGWLFVPFLGYDYLDTQIDAFTETQGQGWELAFDEQKVQSQIISAGLRTSYTHSASWGVLIPHLRIASQHELEDDLRVITARFAFDPGDTRFRFFTDAPDSSFFQVAAGVSAVFENGVSAFVDYETLTGYNNLTSSTLTLGLRFERRFK